jgi:hypothetical protein
VLANAGKVEIVDTAPGGIDGMCVKRLTNHGPEFAASLGSIMVGHA